MKFNDLRSIGHNIADSLASGVSMLINEHDLDPFGEAERSRSGALHVDFLKGTSSSTSPRFRQSIARLGDALPALCRKHGASRRSYRRLQATYVSDGGAGRFFVLVEDQHGRSAIDEYAAHGGRFRVLDRAGRVRRKRASVITLAPASEGSPEG